MIMDVVVDDVVGQARSQDFFMGEGGAYLKNRDQIINVWIIRHGTSEVTQGQSVQHTNY